MEKGFLDKVEDNAIVKYVLGRHSERNAIVLQRDMHQNCGISLVSVVKVDKHLFRALAQFWNPTYSCFTFGKVDLVAIVEEYTTLLRCPKIQVDKAYSRAACVPPLLKKLMNIIGMSE
ncbi:hypothetical protein Goshw_028053 [Gossypium schwendimanii]|uniref:DUF7745 domain-containing protein n=1 Tax=Gossypium schwendimanii TaxID=34291 RepID=A0A7J9MYB7_GOSSC|nr:hypothetical protein [Gossypium schwendimanii]